MVGRTSTILAGVLLGIRGGGVTSPPGCSNPVPISGQKTLFSIPLFRPWLDRQPKKIVEIQFERYMLLTISFLFIRS